MLFMLGAHDLPQLNLQALPPEAAAWFARLQHAEQLLALRDQAIVERDRALNQVRDLLQRKDRDMAWRDSKIEKITFELARLKRWKFGSKSELMNADQRRLFEETVAEDEASLRAQLEQQRREAAAATVDAKPKAPPRRPFRQALPEHLRRVKHRHEPDSTECQEPGCGRPMTRIGEDMSERHDIVPAEFFVCVFQRSWTPISGRSWTTNRRRRGGAGEARKNWFDCSGVVHDQPEAAGWGGLSTGSN